MDEILHANIFFVIASVAVVCFVVLVCIALYHVIKILRLIRSILTRVELGSSLVAENLTQLKATLAEGGIISRLFGMVLNGLNTAAPKRKRTFTKRNENIYDKQETS